MTMNLRTQAAPAALTVPRGPAARWAAALVALVCCAAAWTAGHAAAQTASASWNAATPVHPLLWLVRSALAVTVAWLAAVFALEALAGLPGGVGQAVRRLRDRLGPWGGGAVVSLAFGLLTAPTTAAADAPTDPLDLTQVTAPATPAPATPDAADTQPRPAPTAPDEVDSPADGPSTEDVVTAERSGIEVRAGDTLWDIAARHLGPHATATAVAAEWPRWHEANREAIGDDPHLLLPGTRLTAPAAVQPSDDEDRR